MGIPINQPVELNVMSGFCWRCSVDDRVWKLNPRYDLEVCFPLFSSVEIREGFWGGITWRIIPVSKWLITMVSKSPK